MKMQIGTLFVGIVGVFGCAGADPERQPGDRLANAEGNGSVSFAQEGATFDVSPTTDLRDGQTISLVLDNFTPNTQIGVGQCRATVPASLCSNNSYLATTDANGHFSGLLLVFRTYTSMGGELISCAEPGSCVAGISPISDLGVSFREPLEFAEPRPRTLQIQPNPAAVGETLRFFGTGWRGIASLHVSVCAPGSVPGECPGITVSAFEDGLFSAQLPAPALVRTSSGFVDCTSAPGACVGLVGEVANPAGTAVEVPLTIQGAPVVSGTARLKVRGQNASGDWGTRVRGAGWAPNRELLVLQCFGEDLSICAEQPSVTTDARGRFRACRDLQTQVFGSSDWDCQTGNCSLVIADPNALTSSAVRLPLELRERNRVVPACD